MTANSFMTVGELGQSATETGFSAVFPVAATIDRLFIHAEGANGAGNTSTYTVFVNGTATSVTCNYTNAAGCSDTAHNAPIGANQTISVKVTGANAGKPVHFSLRVAS